MPCCCQLNLGSKAGDSRLKGFVIGLLANLFFLGVLAAQTNFTSLVQDGAWTWFNDPRAIFHNGILYVGYVRNADGASVLSAFNPQTGATTDLWASAAFQKDDHNNPGLLVKHDGTMLAIYARHNSDQFFRYRLSNSTNPVSPADWSAELTIPGTGYGVTYANPFELTTESNRIYNFMRDLNFNPTVVISTNGGSNWSAPQWFIKTGTGSIRPYVKYCSDYSGRIDFLYTDGHPRDLTNSLYHFYYRTNTCLKTDGTVLKSFSSLPIEHDAGERGSVIYQYSAAATSDPDEHVPTGRAWCWQIGYQTNGHPVCVFSVQRDQVTGTSWSDARIYYYYARWTGTNWQKRFIAHGGRPLYTPEIDYAGGICFDPEDPSVIYFSSNAQNPFNLGDTTNVPLTTNSRYELYRGTINLNDLNATWQTITTNSPADQLRPYVPPRHKGKPVVIWFRGTYTTYSTYSCEIVGLLSTPVPQPPRVHILNPSLETFAFDNLANKLKLKAIVGDDGIPQAAEVQWTTEAGPTNAVFDNATQLATAVRFPVSGQYTLRVTANDSVSSHFSELNVIASNSQEETNAKVLHLKLDESSGSIAADSSGTGNQGALSGITSWRPQSGIRQGTLEFNGTSGEVIVPDADSLDSTSAFSLCYWFNASVYPADSAGLVCKRNSVSDNNAYTTYLKTSDRRIYVDIVTANDRFASATQIDLNQWYHVSVIYNGSLPSSQRAQLWINGQLDAAGSETSAAIPNYNSSLRLGNTHSGAPNWFKGFIDDVRFYRRALTSQEIAFLANTNKAPQIVLGSTPIFTNRLGAILNASLVPASIALWQQIAGSGSANFTPPNSAVTIATFNRAGDYTARLSASNNLIEVCHDVDVSVLANTNVFEDWSTFYFPGITNAQTINADADPDADGVLNLAEFALGMNPTLADAFPFQTNTSGLPISSVENFLGTNYLTVRLKRPPGRFDVNYTTEVSNDLLHWAALSSQTVTTNADFTETLMSRDSIPAGSSPARFMRFRLIPSFGP